MPIAPNSSIRIMNDWLIGCEVECFGYNRRISEREFAKKLKSIHPKIEIGIDESIEPDYRAGSNSWAIEFRTPPLLAHKTIDVLKNCFHLMRRRQVDTNYSCGLHVNFSPVSDKIYSRLNPLKIFIDPLWKKMAKDFKRLNNECSRPPIRYSVAYKFAKKFQNGMCLSPIELFSLMEEESSCEAHIPYLVGAPEPKTVAINLSYLHPKRTRCSRIEVRAMGNTGYHNRFPEIVKYISESIYVFEKTLVNE